MMEDEKIIELFFDRSEQAKECDLDWYTKSAVAKDPKSMVK